MKYLVVASHGPIANTPKEIIEILKACILPTFDVLLKLEKQRLVGRTPCKCALDPVPFGYKIVAQ